jgi:hypothetical protein
MALNGVRQMKELVIRYSDYDGSSKGIREWLRTTVVSFAKHNPELVIKTELKRNVHPYVRGVYMNGNSKTICIKNLDTEKISGYVADLRNQIGRKVGSTLCCVINTIYLYALCVVVLMHLKISAFLSIPFFSLLVLKYPQTSSNGYSKPVVSKCTSVQGEWHERMDLIGLEMKLTMK